MQSTAIPAVPQNPLPTAYWSRPIESVNDLWSSISGNWLGLAASTMWITGMYNATGNYNPYTTAPTTAHIMWTKPAAPGGLIGGEFGGTDTSNFNAPQQYQPKFQPIIMNGILYYQEFPNAQSNPIGWVAVNLQTGQTLWTFNTTEGLLCGQVLDYVTPNQYGALTYLWGESPTSPHGATTSVLPNPPGYTGETYKLYDAMTGNYILTIANGTGMTLTEDAGGDLIGYYVNTTAGTQIIQGVPVTNSHGGALLECWNSTECIDELNPATPGYSYLDQSEWYWQPIQGAKIPFSDGIMWSAPIATNIAGVPLPSTLAISGQNIENGVILMTAAGSGGTGSFQTGFQIEAGYNANTGAQLWITNRTETPNTRLATLPSTAGVYAEVCIDSAQPVMNGYSMTTGQLVWGPITLPDANPYSSIGGYQYVSANGICYMWGFGGTIYAVNMTTGAFNWVVTTAQLLGPSGSNTPYGVWPLWTFTVGSVAGGELFVPVGHQYSPPMFRGANQLAINITNGQLVWDNMGFDVVSGPAISDGIMTAFSSYDNQIYAYGQGPSATTVSAPSVGVTTATPVTITGTVMDISAGSQQEAVAANFPNGLPCVSDASMTQWMEYVYEQQPMPTNATGVQVTLTAIDPNHNFITLGTTTTDTSGNYGFSWTPPSVPGPYQIIATFSGTNSYYSSSDTTYVNVQASATPAPTAVPVTGLATMSALTYGIVAVIIVIIIAIVIVGLLLLRKKP